MRDGSPILLHKPISRADMIISHKHRFIFVRTRKVASSSLEIALTKLLDPNDFATRQSDREKQTGQLLPDFDSRVFGGFDKRLRPIFPYGHAPITQAYRLFGRRVQDYKVFSVDRNPWDRAVSTFFWSNRSTNMRELPEEEQRSAFRAFLTNSANPGLKRRLFGINAHRDISQRHLYCIAGVPMVDFMLRFENLSADLEQLSSFLELPEPIDVANIHAKTQHRPKTSRAYQSFYDDETRKLVEDAAQWEIKNLGYCFDNVPPRFEPDPKRTQTKARYLARVSRSSGPKLSWQNSQKTLPR